MPKGSAAPPARQRVALISDFFFPSIGGVENHINSLAQCLTEQGHSVIVITHQHGTREAGTRSLAGGFKVYHLPFAPRCANCVLPTGVRLLPYLHDVLAKERITVVHTHAVCTMAFEAMMLASLLGYNVVHTEHSNYGLQRLLDVPLNKLQQLVLAHSDAIISVSSSNRDNIAARCRIDPADITVIPNAVDASRFRPARGNVYPKETVNVVWLQRMVWRKGTHLLVQIVPEICRRFPYVHFIIGGDGPKRRALEEMRARYGLHDRVELLGAVEHCDVPAVLTRGHIFLTTSLTEAFCISLIEAIACGLTVLSTRVGGVAEELPSNMVHLAEPDADSLLDSLSQLVPAVRQSPGAVAHELHAAITRMYSWSEVASRAAKVYERLADRPRPSLSHRMIKLCRAAPVTALVAFVAFLVQGACLLVLRLYWKIAEAIPASGGKAMKRATREAREAEQNGGGPCLEVPAPAADEAVQHAKAA